MSYLGHAGRITRLDVLRMVRKHADWKGGLGGAFSFAASALIVLLASLGGGYAGYRVGLELTDPDSGLAGFADADGLAAIGGFLALFTVIVAVVFLIRAIGQRGTLEQAEGTLTVITTGEAFLGTLVAEYAFLLLWLTGPAVGIGVGLALGTGTPWPAITLPLAAAAIGFVGVGLGYPAGIGVRHVFTRFPVVERNKSTILVLVFVGYFAFIMTGTLNQVIDAVFEPLQASPLAWYAHVAFLGLPAFPTDPLLAAGTLAVTGAVGALSVVVGTRIARIHWFSDPALAGEPEEAAVATETPDRGVERYLEPLVGRKAGALVTLSWRRAKRSPLKLLYAMYPLFFLMGAFADIVQTGEVPAYLPYMMILVVTWGAGVVFTLNPLGDQGAGLSTSLLSEVDGRTFVHAHLFASLAIAIPLGVLVTGITGILSPVEVTTVALLVAATPVVMLVSATLSIGIGMAFPKFEATNVTRAMKTVLPSTMGFLLFSAHLFLTAVAAAVVYAEEIRNLAAAFLSFVIPFGVSVPPGTLYWVCAALLVPLVLAPIPAYRYAVRRFDRYTIA